ncbi:AraC family transcriptional regulator [Oceanobacter kriegii]|uniref:AraC family transcriptional regulator n=1 Tax=Oceanobacter kriegii TaxID=64972 RepID=UPI0004096FD1|nr:AraC family transcriptional regulator [Oceanobacter kriegii]
MQTTAVATASDIAMSSFPGNKALKRGAWVIQNLPSHSGVEFRICHLCSQISCTVSSCDVTEDFENQIPYDQPVTLLVFGLQGQTRFRFADGSAECVVREGDVWLINTVGAPIQRHTPGRTHARMAVLKYSTARINEAFTEEDDIHQLLDQNRIVRLARQQPLDKRVARIMDNPMQSPSSRILAEAKALEILAHWVTTADSSNLHHDGQPDDEPSPRSQALKQVIAHLISDLTRAPSLQDLARASGISHTCLNRHFRKQYGMTVFEWFRAHKLERAQKYLADEQRSITDIAHQCGFSSASHFGQCFKKQYGCSPAQYREQQGPSE